MHYSLDRAMRNIPDGIRRFVGQRMQFPFIGKELQCKRIVRGALPQQRAQIGRHAVI